MSEAHQDKVLEALSEREPTLDPGRRIVDAHHHLWPRYRAFGYLPEEYAEDVSTHNVEASVFVECMAAYRRDGPEHLRPVGETCYIIEACPPPSRPGAPFVGAGIVGRADLMRPAAEVRVTLEAHAAAGGDRFKGIRYSTIWWPEPEVLPGKRRNAPGIMGSKEFLGAFAELDAMGFTFDAWLAFPQLSELASLADRFPETVMVLNHFGGPIHPLGSRTLRQETFEAWRQAVADVALRPNVRMKLGGVGMSVFGLGYDRLERSPSSDTIAQDWWSYVDFCLESFGAARCMFESNFSPDKAGVTFHNQWNGFKKMTAACSEAEKDRLFKGTAEDVYGLRSEVAGDG
jgi:L-fuconolactonase